MQCFHHRLCNVLANCEERKRRKVGVFEAESSLPAHHILDEVECIIVSAKKTLKTHENTNQLSVFGLRAKYKQTKLKLDHRAPKLSASFLFPSLPQANNTSSIKGTPQLPVAFGNHYLLKNHQKPPVVGGGTGKRGPFSHRKKTPGKLLFYPKLQGNIVVFLEFFLEFFSKIQPVPWDLARQRPSDVLQRIVEDTTPQGQQEDPSPSSRPPADSGESPRKNAARDDRNRRLFGSLKVLERPNNILSPPGFL